MARSKATTRVFAWAGDITTVVDAWASDLGFEKGPSDDGVLRYWRAIAGTKNFDLSGFSVTATHNEGHVELLFSIVSTMGLTTMFTKRPSSSGIEPGGFLGYFHRRRARVQANDLLARFGQPPIT